MKTYRDEAVVLRTHPLGEADRIITLLTRQHGQVRAVAKGVRRTGSRFGSRLEPFTVVDTQLYRGRNLDTVTQVETLYPNARSIVADYRTYTAASAIVETAERLTADDDEAAGSHYLLLIGALAALARRRHDASLILDSYLLRSLALAGWAPSCFDCAQCGAAGPHRAWSSPLGGVVCPRCRPPGAASPSDGALELLGALLSGDWPAAEATAPPDRSTASGLVASHLHYHLERQVSALRHVERV